MFGEDTEAPNPDCKKWRETIKLFALILCLFGIAKMFTFQAQDPIRKNFLNQGLMDLITSLVLYCAAAQINYCLTTIFVFMTFYEIFWIISALGSRMQRESRFRFMSEEPLTFSVLIISLTIKKNLIKKLTD